MNTVSTVLRDSWEKDGQKLHWAFTEQHFWGFPLLVYLHMPLSSVYVYKDRWREVSARILKTIKTSLGYYLEPTFGFSASSLLSL